MPRSSTDHRLLRGTLFGLILPVLLLGLLAAAPHVADDMGGLHDHLDRTCLTCVAAAHPAVAPDLDPSIEQPHCTQPIATPPAETRPREAGNLAYLSRAPPVPCSHDPA